MRKRTVIGLLAACVLGLAGCQVDREVDAGSRRLFDEIRQGADLTQDQTLSADMRTPEAVRALSGLRQAIPGGEPRVSVRRWSINTNNGNSSAEVVHVYAYPNNGPTLVTETVARRAAGETRWTIVGFHMRQGS